MTLFRVPARFALLVMLAVAVLHADEDYLFRVNPN
jgi:hypothetical protein